eukprot:TRINITY_DN2608_c0_g1::TRINITY_DN2608_c0_g1_i1::g.26016::m.26016 TRINITY_DN2608_c0_g1::TRINITY_DN2608_c0_g1_i1::g.26016  ORF type:complete len:391 (+),score=123.64,sp/Q9SLK2/ALIS3_ARATH/40.68/3e-76,CDC50/PF03381.10/4.5e-81,DUF3899/PF13038.1/63,DUF3899/PF13038.1/17 TRINITY_DN2608_c0_g1_i1:50-1174(+)
MADERKRKPQATAFRQQQLKAWQPILTPSWVISSFFVVSVIFIPIGAVIISYSNKVVEASVQYNDECKNIGDYCNVKISIDDDLTCTQDDPCYMYYELTKFYQNHRRYVKSRSDIQLQGDAGLTKDDLADCDPVLEYDDLDPEDRSKLPIDITVNPPVFNPCGLIAWSYFNDTITLCVDDKIDSETNLCVNGNFDVSQDGIAWSSDKDAKFKTLDKEEACGDFKETTDEDDPRSDCPNIWGTREDDDERVPCTKQDCYDFVDRRNALVKSESFIVWMRTAGLPTFKKLHAKITTDMKKGDYAISILNNFDVEPFGGTKSVVISTTTWLGGKNPFLGYAYVIVGAICFALATGFLIKHLYSPRKLGDSKHLVWSH